MLTDINMNTVDFAENYDGTQEEPTVLPARLPNMLLNGASGIAVGMATNIPPHNLRELAEAIIYLIDNFESIDSITVDDLMQFVKGPDFPTGATIVVGDELREAYATGKGRVVVRSSAEFEEGRSDNFNIVFTSIPYQIGKSTIIERIVSLVREGRIEAIRDLRDESRPPGIAPGCRAQAPRTATARTQPTIQIHAVAERIQYSDAGIGRWRTADA